MNEIEERKNALRDEFSFFENPQERFEYIISKTKRAPGLESEYKVDANLVRGCASSLWLVPSFEGGKCSFRSDADSIITKGVANLVCGMLSGLTPAQIEEFGCEFLEEIGIAQYLSPNRRNGLSMLCKKIFDFAKSHA